MHKTLILVVLLSLIQASCQTYGLKDLQLEGISISSTKEEPYLKYWTPSEGIETRDFEVLKLKVSSIVDLIALSTEKELNITSQVFLCENEKIKFFSPVISTKNNRLWFPAGNDIQNLNHLKDVRKRINYYINIPFSRNESVQIDNTENIRYNHLVYKSDLCARFRGGSMFGSTFRSNVVVVPYGLIVKTLDLTNRTQK